MAGPEVRLIATLALIVITFGGVGPAVGDAAAQQLFREGRRLMKRGDLAAACDRFERSRRLEAKVGTLLNLADCHEKRGRLATAWGVFLEAKALAARTNDPRLGEALRRVEALEPRLAYLTIKTPDVAGLVVRRNGDSVDAAVWNQAVPFDDGEQSFEAEAPGYRPWSTRLTLEPGQRVVVEVALDPAPAAPAQVTEAIRPGDRPASRASRTVGLGLLFGANSRERPLLGVHGFRSTTLPGAALRASVSLMVSRYEDNVAATGEPDRIVSVNTAYVGAGFDYVRSPVPQLAYAVGLGLGLEVDQEPDTTDFGGALALRASPVIVTFLDGELEAGLHAQLAFAGSEVTLHALVGIDWLVR